MWGREGCPECSGAFLALPAEGLGPQMEVAGRGFRVCQMVGGGGGWHVKSSIADAAGGCERVTLRASLCLHTVPTDSPRLYRLVGETPKATQ